MPQLNYDAVIPGGAIICTLHRILHRIKHNPNTLEPRKKLTETTHKNAKDQNHVHSMPEEKDSLAYDPEQLINEAADLAAKMYNKGESMNEIAREMGCDSSKVRKLLVTATTQGKTDYINPNAAKVLSLWGENKTVEEIMEITGLSRSCVCKYTPYTRAPYYGKEISEEAENERIKNARRRAVERLRDKPGIETLWESLTAFQGFRFHTPSGQKFTFEVRGDRLAVDHEARVIKKGTVKLAYEKALRMKGNVPNWTALNVAEAKYIYPIFMRLKIIR